MTDEEIKDRITEHKECCKKLAEEYRQRYNEDRTDKLALNMFYHNVIAYNNYEDILAMIEDRNSIIMCFSNPPILTEETVEVDIKHIAELEKENAELNSIADFQTSSNMDRYFQLKRSKEQLIKAKKIIRDYKIVVEGDHTTVCSVPEENRCINVLKLNEQAEQFLKEVSE